MFMKTIVYVGFCLIFSSVVAQSGSVNAFTLNECIKVALENNLDLKSSALNANTATINFSQSKTNILPTLNSNYNLGINNGRSIDPFTNDFIDQKLTFSTAALSLNMTIFNGFRLLNTVKQQRLNKQASEMEIEEAKQTLMLQVTLAYLQVLNSKDVLELAKKNKEATVKQYKRQEDLFNEQIGNPADLADVKGQKAIDETAILVAKSSLQNAKLDLIQLLNLKTIIDIETVGVLMDFEEYILSSEKVFAKALKNLATFEVRELKLEASKKGVKIAKSQFVPEVSFFGELNTNFSSVAETFTETNQTIVETGDFVTINNQDFLIQTNETQFKRESIGYSDQLNNNLNTVVGVSVQIPVFNGFIAKNNVAIEKIKVEESVIELERTEQQIKNAIEQVYFDMKMTYKRHQSLLSQVQAFEESFRINEIRFNNGVSNFVAYVTSKNNLEKAKNNLINAKYEYLLRVRILEFYRGETIGISDI